MSGVELAMTRKGGALVPTSPAFLEDLETVPEGREVMVSVRMVRNARQDRWFHACVSEIVKAGVWSGTAESFRRYLKIALGYTEEVIGPDGTVHHALQSLSPASMDGLAFREFIKRVEHHLAETFAIDISQFRAAVRGRAGVDAEPKDTGERGAPSPVEAAPGPADASPAIDKDLLWRLSAALGAAKTKPAIIQAAADFKVSNRELESPALAARARAVCKLHIVHRLEPSYMPLPRFEAALVALIDNGVMPE